MMKGEGTMRNEKMLWRDEDTRKSREARRRRVERKIERDDEMLIKRAIALFNDYDGDFRAQIIS